MVCILEDVWWGGGGGGGKKKLVLHDMRSEALVSV